MRFTKMQGLGNDYLYVYGDVPDNVSEISTKMSDRHFGAGADGMIYISDSPVADFSMRIFNADGSEAKMCGNGIRCVGKYVYDKGYTDKTNLKIETLSGIKKLKLNIIGKRVKTVTVDMGIAAAENESTVCIDGGRLTYTPVSVGNPHAVVFVDEVYGVPVASVGQEFQNSAIFPDGVNVEFAQVLSKAQVRMRVFERGSGVTMACGTGACAVAAAAVSKGLCMMNTPITVMLDGGNLEITVLDGGIITMTGPAQTVYEGEAEI